MKRTAAIVWTTLLLAGCDGTPLGYLGAAGPAARAIANLGWGLIAICIAATLIVSALLAYAIWHRRATATDELGGGDDRTPIRWIVAGTGISTVFLLAAAVWTLLTVQSVGDTSKPPALIIDVTGHQWWWEAHYNSDTASRAFTTANELVIPAGVSVQINLRSSDVIHSFWVPKLAGKTDTIPGITNVTRIEADASGIYRGQCTEFCGLQHAQMAFNVVAMTQGDFTRWCDTQLQAAKPSSTDPGQQLFLQKCASCHMIRGLTAGGILGPDLSHFGSRLV